AACAGPRRGRTRPAARRAGPAPPPRGAGLARRRASRDNAQLPYGRHLGRIPARPASDRAPRARMPARNESPMSTEALKIEKDRVVRFHYTVSEPGQEPLETSKERDPLAILAGHGNIIPGLDKALEGHVA